MKEIRLDLVGEICPIPLLKVRERLSKLKKGQRLIILTDQTVAIRNIMDLLEEKGYDFEVEEPKLGIWQIDAVKG
ncbi:sulfurtransferase TusA family protein [Halonatronum saccharophilum]|uniref:sulfurtransferase TusA family protein n=1 Tax=Halonatronum saccharophilum TaxID=150060 RepID=UPI00048411B3|nr:sulfurtransferase TusA family protein [Halonatronum saccharophilum]